MASKHDAAAAPDKELLRAVVDVLILGEPFVQSLWRASGLTLTQIRVLRAIQRGCPSAGALAHDVGVPPSSLSRMLERLDKRGLVVRDVDREDRRRVRIAVTAAGESFLNALPALADSPLGQALEDLGADEREALVRGVAALVAASRRRATAEAAEHEPERPEHEEEEAHDGRGT